MTPREPMRRVRLGTILALLLFTTIVPLVLFSGYLVYRSWQEQQGLVNRQNVERARAASVAVDQEVQSTITALTSLATLGNISTADYRPFYDAARAMLTLQPGWQAVRLVTPDSQVLVDTSVAFGQPTTLTDDEWVRRVGATRRPAISSAIRDQATGGLFVAVGVPVLRDGQLAYVLGARIAASELSKVLKQQQAPRGGVVALMDANFTILARTRAEDVYVGQRPTDQFAASMRTAQEGAQRSVLLEGTPSYSAWSRSSTTGWTIGLGLPAADVDGPIIESLRQLVTVGIAILAGGLILAFLVRWRIVRAQMAAVSAARELARGEPPTNWQSRVAEFNDLASGLRGAGEILDRRIQERDEAERKRAQAVAEVEQTLLREHAARMIGERNEARLRVTLLSIGDAVIATDAEGRVTVLNPVAQTLTGWAETDAVGTAIEQVFVTRDAAVPNGGAGPSQAVLISRDGRETPIGTSASPIQSADGALLGTVVVFRDMTAERNAERQQAAAFEREQSARRTAEGLSRAKDEFVATVSHELRTPLNAIFGWVAMLKMGALDEAGATKALEVIDRNTRVQARLIEDLLDMARVIRGTVRLELQEIDVISVVELAVDAVRPAADARRVRLSVHGERGVACVSGDASRLQQIAWNLLSNAIKFSEAGDAVNVSVDAIGDEVVLVVKDTGAGIDAAFLPHVFERFRQEASDVTREHAGLGLGLSLVRHLAELHGGTVTAESEGKWKGSTFTVRLPRVGTEGSTSPGERGESIAPEVRDSLHNILDGLYIVAVDDDQDARELVATVLRQAGAEVTAAASVKDALVAIDARLPHVVVTDIAMPHATGFDLVRELTSRSDRCDIPVMALTAYGRAEDRAQALSLGFTAHLGKPFAPRALVTIVAEVCGR